VGDTATDGSNDGYDECGRGAGEDQQYYDSAECTQGSEPVQDGLLCAGTGNINSIMIQLSAPRDVQDGLLCASTGEDVAF
jgi:hypothetical protein